MTDPTRAYRSAGTINGHAAEVSLIAQDNPIHGTSWSGSAHITDVSIDLLEFTGLAELVINDRTATVEITDATPGSGYIYFRGHDRPPFDLG